MEKQIIHTELAPAAIGPYSQAVKAGDFVFVSGCLPIDMTTGALHTGDITQQTRCAMTNLGEILKAAGSGLDNVVKTTIFVADLANFQTINSAYGEFFPNGAPARSCVQVAALPKNAELEIEAIAIQKGI